MRTSGQRAIQACVEPPPSWLRTDERPLDWNGPVDRACSPLSDRDLDRPIVEHLERVAALTPERIAVRDFAGTLTFGELWNGVSGLAGTLAAETRPGDLIALLLPADPLFPVALLACFAAGRPCVVLDVHHPVDWIDGALCDTRPALVVTQHDGSVGLEARLPAMRVLRLSGVPRCAGGGRRPTAAAVDEPACVLFTSGSTGRPKSIVNSQRNLLQRVAQSINAAHINSADRLLTLASPGTIVAVRDLLTALLAGASFHLLDPRGAGGRQIVNTIRGDAATILFAFPALLRSIVPAGGARAGASLRLVRVGGDTTLWRDVDALRAWLAPDTAVQIVYAATEAPMMQWFVADACRRDNADGRVPIGYPLPGNDLELLDDNGYPTPAGDVGELVVTSAYVSLGRWIDGRMHDDGAGTGGEGGRRVFRTGDLVRQRPDGLLERVGRKDRQLKIRGSRVDLEGVESMLRAHPGVLDVAAVARRNPDETSVSLVAYVTAGAGAEDGLLDELRALMAAAPPAMRPARFHLVSSIPRQPSSKLDVQALTALDEAHARYEGAMPADGAAAVVGDPVTAIVARVWQQVLLVPVRGEHDDFFDSGGDSLKAIRFVSELERALGFEIPLAVLTEAPAFGQLCHLLRERRAPSRTPLVKLKEGSGLPPVFFIHGAGGHVGTILPAARCVSYAGAVIGIRARGVVPGEVPHVSIEAMAADYLKEIKDVQPDGPYFLCGYSSGGLVAFEIARRLSESGDTVAFVGLFDTMVNRLHGPLRAWRAILAGRVRTVAAWRPTSMQLWPAAIRRSAQRLRTWRRRGSSVSSPATPARFRVMLHAFFAAARYQPGFYRGALTLFSPTGRAPGSPSLESLWRQHARAIAVVDTPGTHGTMLSAIHAEMTAARLTRCLREAHESVGGERRRVAKP